MRSELLLIVVGLCVNACTGEQPKCCVGYDSTGYESTSCGPVVGSADQITNAEIDAVMANYALGVGHTYSATFACNDGVERSVLFTWKAADLSQIEITQEGVELSEGTCDWGRGVVPLVLGDKSGFEGLGDFSLQPDGGGFYVAVDDGPDHRHIAVEGDFASIGFSGTGFTCTSALEYPSGTRL